MFCTFKSRVENTLKIKVKHPLKEQRCYTQVIFVYSIDIVDFTISFHHVISLAQVINSKM